jgi:cathepsin B
MRFFATLVAAAASAGTVQITATDCGSASDKGSFKGITTSPNPIVLGGDFQIDGMGSLKEQVTNGQYEVKVTGPLGIQLLDHKDTICGPTSFNLPLGMGTFQVSGIDCPHAEGDVTITQKGSLPSSIPAKEAKINLVTKDQDNNQVLCVNFDMKIVDSLMDETPSMRDAFNALVAKYKKELTHELTDKEVEQWFYNWKNHVEEESQAMAKNAPLSAHRYATLLEDELLDARPAITEAYVKELNAKKSTFTSEVSARFQGWSVKKVKKIMGSAVGDAHMALPRWEKTPLKGALPESFDSRDQWKNCPTIGHIRDQSTCGSCWAFGSTEAFNDRACIASGGKFTEMLSAQETTSCCGLLQCASQGCNGGQPGMAWNWLVKRGVVSGGDFGDKDTCWPYEMEQCAHHVTSPTYQPCGDEKPTPSCKTSCTNSGQSFTKVNPGGKAYSLGSTDEIKQSIMEKGPVTGAFTVYEDFVTYKSGVYKHTSGQMLGGHAIKIIGWGKDATAGEYWIVNNSWNESWGDNGTFKIAFGECGIDSQVSAGDVNAPSEAFTI